MGGIMGPGLGIAVAIVTIVAAVGGAVMGSTERLVDEGEPVAAEDRRLEAENRRLARELEELRARLDEAERKAAVSILSLAMDVAAHRAAEDELRRATALLHTLVETSPDPVFAKDREGRMLLASPATLRVIGKPAEQVLGHTVSEWHDDPAQAASLMAQDRAVLETGEVQVFEQVLDTPEGQRVFLGTKLPVRDEHGQVVGLIGTTRDITERKRMEEALREREQRLQRLVHSLRESEQKLQRLFRDAPAQISVHEGPEHVIRFSNALSDRILGYRPLLGLPLREALPEVAGQGLFERFDHVYATGEPTVIQESPVRFDRHGAGVLDLGYFNIALQPWFDAEGRVAGVLAFAFEVTEQVRAREAVRESEARFRQLVESLPQLVWSCRPDGDCDYLSPQWLAYTGRPAAEHLGSGWREALHPDDHDRTVAAFEAALAGRGVYDLEYRLRGADGGYRWFHARCVALRDADGRIVRWFGTSTDVHDRKLAEERLREAEESFRTLADNIAQLAWMADANGAIFWYNERWFEYTGMILDQMLGWGWRAVHHPEHVDRVVEKYRRCIEAGEAWEDTFPLRGKDGAYRWFLSRAIPIRDHDGKVQRWFGTNTDITAQREVEEALKEADRRKDEFLAMLAHELRNPLAPIRTALEVLNIAGADAVKARQMRDMIERQVTHMARLIDDLLDVSRIARGKVQLRMERCDLVAIVRDVAEDYRPILSASGLILAVDLPAAPLWLRGDATRLAQVIGNLLSNASKFSQPGGRVDVRVEAEPTGRAALVAVRDTGMGIEPAMLGQVFEPFIQADLGLDRSKGGLGLGLALVRGLVELHGGAVEVRSEGLGKGATFGVRLPLAPDEAAAGAGPAERAARAGGGLRILVIEDNRDTADSLQELLTLIGHQVEVAYAGPAGLELASRFRPDVVLCDIGLPGLDGFEVARALRRDPAARDAYLVAQSGYGQEEDRRRARAAGFDLHLRKPVGLAELQRILAGVTPR
jgi:PAS domain S-box-containing protein